MSSEAAPSQASTNLPQTQNPPTPTDPDLPSEEEIRSESGKAAEQCLRLQQKAYNLKQAAYGAGDPDERQKLLEQAIDAEIAAESFGKTAKYLRSGTFQGMAVGSGMGIMPGMTLGALTGTLVGGVVSAVTGTLGAGIGALVGAVHGPFWNMGEVVGRGVRGITGDLPGWRASDEQRERLEEMIRQVKERDMPGREALKEMARDAGGVAWNQWGGTVKGWGDYAWSWVPGYSSWGKNDKPVPTGEINETKARKEKRKEIEKTDEGRVDMRTVDELPVRSKEQETAKPGGERRKPRKLEQRSRGASPGQHSHTVSNDTQRTTQGSGAKKTTTNGGPPGPRKPPRKLEVRSQA